MHKVGLGVLLAGFVLGYGNPALARECGGGHHDGVGRDGNESASRSFIPSPPATVRQANSSLGLPYPAAHSRAACHRHFGTMP